MRLPKEYTKEDLMTMPLVALRNLDIETPEQGRILQEVVDNKLAGLPVQKPIFRRDVPDIQTPEQEAKWQEVMRQREAKLRGQIAASETAPETAPETAEPSPIVPPEVPVAPSPSAPVPPPVPESAMAQATGEGEPVTFNSGVVKVDKRTKVYKDSLQA